MNGFGSGNLGKSLFLLDRSIVDRFPRALISVQFAPISFAFLLEDRSIPFCDNMTSLRCVSALSLLALLSLGTAQKCKIQFDGRIPANFGAASFSATNNFFSSANVLGAGLSFSQLIIPGGAASLVGRPALLGPWRSGHAPC